MKFTTLKNNPLIGKVYNDNKNVCLGLYGQVGVLLEEDILRDTDAGKETWIFLPANAIAAGYCAPQASKVALKAYLLQHLNESNLSKKKPKLYPFSAEKHAHDIEFRKNRVANELHDLLNSEGTADGNQIDKMEALLNDLRNLLSVILGTCRDGKIAYLTGPQIALAKESVAWAAEARAGGR